MFKKSDKASKPADASKPAASAAPAAKPFPAGKQAYEARRAAKAGVSLERWMADKQKRAQAEREAVRRAQVKSPSAKPGFLKRLLDRAHKPL
jgi:hypothetical protein